MLSEKALERRRRYLTSSDAPAICGLNPPGWRTAADVWAEKVRRIVPSSPTDAMMTGNRLERSLIEYVSERTSRKVVRNQFRVCPEHRQLAATLDGLIDDNRGLAIVEVKYVSSYWADAWGPEDTDVIPEHVLAQVAHQMACVPGATKAYIGVALALNRIDWRMYTLRASDLQPLIERLVRLELEFWENYVVPVVPPPAEFSMDTLKRLIRSGDMVRLDAMGQIAAERYLEARERRRAAEAEEERAQASLLSCLGQAECGVLPDGRIVTYRMQKGPRRCDFDALRQLDPALYEKVVGNTEFRVLRIQKGEQHARRNESGPGAGDGTARADASTPVIQGF
jgi:putative phage-type endonuclease